MFWSKKGHPPLSTFQRVDIELLMRRSIETIGPARVSGATMVTELRQLCLDDSSPSLLLKSASAAVRDKLPPLVDEVSLDVCDGEDLGYPSLYVAATGEAPATIKLAAEVLEDPLRTVTELAYQYSTHFWHGIPDPAPLDTDPRTTNLLPICCGLGVLCSDSSLYDRQWSQGGYAGWSLSRSGYYTAEEIGYALALLARFVEREPPDWEQRLRLDSRETLIKARHYFAAGEGERGRLLFDAETIPSSTIGVRHLAEWLRGDDPAFALAAAYAMCKLEDLTPVAIDSVVAATSTFDRDLLPLLATLLGRARVTSPEAKKQLQRLMKDRHAPTAMAAIQSADQVGMSLSQYRSRVSKLLDCYATDPFKLLIVIENQGAEFASLEPQLCEHLRKSIIDDDQDRTDALVRCLASIIEKPRDAIERRIRSPKIRAAALLQLEDTS